MTAFAYRTKREVATNQLREAIICGELAPGTRLVLEELSQRYNVSMTPIREAFSLLESEGLIAQSPHKGAVVAGMDREDLLELYAIRAAVEELATLQGVPRLAEEDLRAMSSLLDALERFDGPQDGFLDIDKQFHRVVYRAAGSPRWLETIETLWQRSRRYMLASTSVRGAVASLHADHRAILQACREHDAARAAAVVRDHLKRSEERLLSELRGAQQ
jgi:DNA-binding GntR family transcriptional regulator